MAEYRFFFGKEDIESNFHPAKFIYKNIQFNCTEQAFMWSKATYFGDTEIANKILLLVDPKHQKHAGKLVKGYEEEKWNKASTEVMFQVNLEKYLQNKNMGDYLLSTKPKILVEASPFDRKWGIGLSVYDAIRSSPRTWPGENRLGKILMDVREIIG